MVENIQLRSIAHRSSEYTDEKKLGHEPAELFPEIAKLSPFGKELFKEAKSDGATVSCLPELQLKDQEDLNRVLAKNGIKPDSEKEAEQKRLSPPSLEQRHAQLQIVEARFGAIYDAKDRQGTSDNSKQMSELSMLLAA